MQQDQSAFRIQTSPRISYRSLLKEEDKLYSKALPLNFEDIPLGLPDHSLCFILRYDWNKSESLSP